jgi:hypothetical protein
MLFDLKFAILRSGRTQREVSLAAEIVETRFSEIVRGRCLPTAREQERIADVLGVSASSLFPLHLPDRQGGER